MNKLPVYFALTAVAFFALGFLAGRVVDYGEIPQDLARATALEVPRPPASAPAASPLPASVGESQEEAALDVAVSNAAPPDDESRDLRFGELSRDRTQRSLRESMKQMLADFFTVYQIPQDQADAILEGLVDAQIEQMEFFQDADVQKLFSNQDLSEEDQLAAQGYMDEAQFAQEQRTRQVLGMYYEDYSKYMASLPQQQLLADFSDSLDVPLNSATRDELLQIFIDESKPVAPLETARVGRLSQEDVMAHMQRQIDTTRERNERIKQRASSYLTLEQFEQLASALDKEVARNEAMMKVMELSDDF